MTLTSGHSDTHGILNGPSSIRRLPSTAQRRGEILDPQTRYRVDARNVVHETIEGEVIVIHLLNGSYYSLGGGAPEIWEHLLSGASSEQLAAAIPARGAADGEVAKAVDEFLAALLEDGLIVADGDGAPVNGAPAAGRAEGAWVPPAFERYTDMKDFFLLDPIHEVDAAGWPNRQAS